MGLPTCHYVKPDGSRCRSLALRGRDYCYHHVTRVQRELRMQKQEVVAQGPPLELPPLRDFNSIQTALMLILNELANERIGPKPAGQLLYALQLARTNLERTMYAPLEEVTALQMALMQVMRDLLGGRIGTRTAGLLLYATQLAMSNSPLGLDPLTDEEEAESAAPTLQ